MCVGDRPRRASAVGVSLDEASLAVRARLVPLQPGMEDAVADPDGPEADAPGTRRCPRVEEELDVIVVVVGVAVAVVDTPDDPVIFDDVRSPAQWYPACLLPGRGCDLHRELVLTAVPDLQFVGRDIGFQGHHGEGPDLSRFQEATGMCAGAEVVADALDDESAGSRLQE